MINNGTKSQDDCGTVSETKTNEPIESNEDAYERLAAIIRQVIRGETPRCLIDAPPGSGKTTTLFKVVSELDIPITYLTKRKDLYEQGNDLTEEFGGDAIIVSSPHRHCNSFDEETPEYNEEAHSLYKLGIGGELLHSEKDLACGPNCEFIENRQRIRESPPEIIIGHYQHAFIPSVIEGRLVVFDEFPGDGFEETFPNPSGIINPFLEQEDGLPFDTYSDLIEYRNDPDIFEKAWSWFLENGADPDRKGVLNADSTNRYHALAPTLVYSILEAEDVDNGFDIPWFNFTAEVEGEIPDIFDRDRRVMRNRENGEVSLLQPLDLQKASGVIALDGTPTKPMWDLALGENLDHIELFETDAEKNAFYKYVQGLSVIAFNDALKPYHARSPDRISFEKDTGIFYEIEMEHGEYPRLVTTKRAKEFYEDEGVDSLIAGDIMNYANVPSNNDFKGVTVGAVAGAPDPGYDDVKKWSGYFGQVIEAKGEGVDRTFGEFGDKIYHHFVHNEVFQAICRFVRGDNGATVYVITGALPEWYEEDRTVKHVALNRQNKRDIADCLRDAEDDLTLEEIAEEVGVSDDTVRRCFKGEDAKPGLIDKGVIEVIDNPGPYKTKYHWVRDTPLHVTHCEGEAEPHIDTTGVLRLLHNYSHDPRSLWDNIHYYKRQSEESDETTETEDKDDHYDVRANPDNLSISERAEVAIEQARSGGGTTGNSSSDTGVAVADGGATRQTDDMGEQEESVPEIEEDQESVTAGDVEDAEESRREEVTEMERLEYELQNMPPEVAHRRVQELKRKQAVPCEV